GASGRVRSGGGDGARSDRVQVEGGRLRFVGAARGTDVDLALESTDPGEATARPLMLRGRGHWRGEPFRIAGAVASPLELRASGTPYAVDLRASAGATRARARGTITRLFHLESVDVRMALSGKDLEDLYPLLALAMPHTPPYALDGRLVRDGQPWRYEDFDG